MRSGGAQAVVLVALAAAWGFGANALRKEPLSFTTSLEPPPPPEAGSGLAALPAADARAAWEAGTFFVDVRDASAFEARRVQGALSVPAAEFDARYFDALSGISGEVPLLVYGASADSFAVRRVADRLAELGHASVSLVVCDPDSLFLAGVPEVAGPDNAGDVP